MSRNEKRIVSMFDESGNMLIPWANAGYQCFAFDITSSYRREEFQNGGSITWYGSDLLDPEWIEFIVTLKPVMVFGFPPCDHLATSGSLHFESKRRANPNFQVDAVRLCRQVELVGNAVGCPWMLENPISVLSSMWRKPNFIFDPFEYGAHLPVDDVHPRWPQYIKARDAYPKRTCIWSGNGFRKPKICPVRVNSGYSDQYKKLGGRSKKTKQIRSETPRGFALAVFKENDPLINAWD